MSNRIGENNHNFRHGYGHGRLYRIYTNMKQRCNNPNNHKYHRYGARGISVCPEWNTPHGLVSFAEWALENGYDDNLTLDRIDNDGNYEPSNCRWVDQKTQSNNRSDNDLIYYNNEIHSLSEWSEILNINRGTLWNRLYRQKMSVSDAFTQTPFVGKNGFDTGVRPITYVIEYNGEIHSCREWGEIVGINGSIIRERIKDGWEVKDALFTPKLKRGIPYKEQISKLEKGE